MDEEYQALVLDVLRDALNFPLDSPARYNRLRDVESLLIPYADNGDEYLSWAKEFHSAAPREGARIATGRFLGEIMGLCRRMGLFLEAVYES